MRPAGASQQRQILYRREKKAFYLQHYGNVHPSSVASRVPPCEFQQSTLASSRYSTLIARFHLAALTVFKLLAELHIPSHVPAMVVSLSYFHCYGEDG